MEGSGNSIKPTSLVTKVRWMSFIAAIWLQAVNGTSFDFSDYSSALKEVMGINQMKLNSLAVASDTGKIMGWVSGFMCMLLPLWAVICISACLGTVGYGVQWLMLTHRIHRLDYWQVYLLCFMAGNSICWFNTVCFRVTIENFPAKRGIASGLTTSYVGLSTVIYTGLSSIVNPGKPSLYLMFNSIVPTAVGVISAFILFVCQPEIGIEDEEDRKNMIICTLIAIVTAIYSVIFEFLPHQKRGNEIIYMAVLVLFLIAPLYVPLKIAFRQKSAPIETKVICQNPVPKVVRLSRDYLSGRTSSHSVTDGPAVNQNGIGKSLTKQVSRDSRRKNSMDGSRRKNSMDSVQIAECSRTDIEAKRFVMKSDPAILLGDNHSILQLLRSVDFWLYYFVYLCGGTVGLVYINNMGQILQSLGYSKTPIVVALVSSSGFLGRIASGLQDYVQQFNRTRNLRIGALPRPVWIGIWMVPMAVAFFVLATVHPSAIALYVSTAIIGASTGAIGSIAIPTSSELFGMERFGVNHNILITNIAFGSVLFGEVAGMVYDAKSRRNLNDRHLCVGKECFQNTFLAWGCVCSLGIVLCVILSVRTRALYESIHKLRCCASVSGAPDDPIAF